MDVVTYGDLREGDVIEIEMDGQECEATVTHVSPVPGKNFLPIGIKMGLLSYGFDHDADDPVILLRRV